jgi:hypothetical protein
LNVQTNAVTPIQSNNTNPSDPSSTPTSGKKKKNKNKNKKKDHHHPNHHHHQEDPIPFISVSSPAISCSSPSIACPSPSNPFARNNNTYDVLGDIKDAGDSPPHFPGFSYVASDSNWGQRKRLNSNNTEHSFSLEKNSDQFEIDDI